VAASCGHGNVLNGSMKGRNFLKYLSDYQFMQGSIHAETLIQSKTAKITFVQNI
jgi:hypothetical protein